MTAVLEYLANVFTCLLSYSCILYLLIDCQFCGNAYFGRMEDVTDPDTLRKQPKTDRSVCLYGYVRGCHYRNHTHVHIPGS